MHNFFKYWRRIISKKTIHYIDRFNRIKKLSFNKQTRMQSCMYNIPLIIRQFWSIISSHNVSKTSLTKEKSHTCIANKLWNHEISSYSKFVKVSNKSKLCRKESLHVSTFSYFLAWKILGLSFFFFRKLNFLQNQYRQLFLITTAVAVRFFLLPQLAFIYQWRMLVYSLHRIRIIISASLFT